MYKHWKKYLIVFVLTAVLFAGARYASRALNREKVADLQATQERVATDVMSSETQFDLLQETSCKDVIAELSGNDGTAGTYLSSELATLADKISYGEQNLNAPQDLLLLKKQYTLTEAKDFLLVRRISSRCKVSIPTVLYFYGTKNACEDCAKQGDVLSTVRKLNPAVHVYSFDYTIDSPTVRALRKIYKVKGPQLPVLVINGKTYNGFVSIDTMLKIIPAK